MPPTFKEYFGRIRKQFHSDAGEWARDNIGFGALMLIVPAVVAFVFYNIKPDLKVIWTTAIVYAVILVIYASIHAVRTPWRLDQDRARTIDGLNQSLVVAEKTIKDEKNTHHGPGIFARFDYTDDAKKLSGYGTTPRYLFIENNGDIDAYEVAVQEICLDKEQKIVGRFEPVPILRKNAYAMPRLRISNVVKEAKDELCELFWRPKETNEACIDYLDEHGWQHVKFCFSVRFKNNGGAWWESEFEFDRQISGLNDAAVVRLNSRKRI